MDYRERLIEEGVAASRVDDLDDALCRLHKALCKLDFANLNLFMEKSIEERLSDYAQDHLGMRDPLQDVKQPFLNVGATALFDDLTEESYYGFNMKIVLGELREWEVKFLRYLVDRCRVGRKAKMVGEGGS